MENSAYKIYNASAGSGKTYTLTKEYLKIILSSDQTKVFSQILAITFTNKAVNEMKQRILDNLYAFGQPLSLTNPSDLFTDVANELNISLPQLQKKTRKIHKNILHNYAFFDISTIDKFTHRLIRTFAKDLKIPQNFEVILDTELLLSEAVDRLIAKAGSDELLTKTLLDFTLEKIDDDKSWDIAYDLNQIGKLLFNENHLASIKKIQGKHVTNFVNLKKKLKTSIKSIEDKIVETARKFDEFVEEEAIDISDFPRKTLPNHFRKIAEGEFNPIKIYNNKLEENLKDAKIFKANLHYDQERIAPLILEIYLSIKEKIYQRAFYLNCYRNIIPLTVLNEIQKEIAAICQERDQLTLSSFNSIISKEIKDQPAPFIYERLGEKYRHYFIDEFQDTSELQWKNLIPLVANALESEFEEGQTGTLFLVGDTKQAIYRWRGGKAEQFLDLVNKNKSPFVALPKVENLPKNYRSASEIVTFNNSFFKVIALFFGNDDYKQLYIEGNQQETNKDSGGLVQVSFISNEKEQNDDECYCNEALQAINSVVKEKQYNYKDICVLVRSNNKGTLLADFLNENKIPLISAESLLLQSSEKVLFLVNLLKYSIQPNDKEVRFDLLYFLAKDIEGVHQFIVERLDSVNAFLIGEFGFNVDRLKQLSVYDGLELIINCFDLSKDSDAYIVNFMDEVLQVEQKEGAGVHTFLSFWEKKKEKLSLKAPDKINAVQIMTVHKSKGLEFPIVIFPFANSEIYSNRNLKHWLPVNSEDFNGFSEILVSHTKEMENYGEIPAKIYSEEQTKLELDAFNVLYVALTRAVKGLYIIGKKDINAKGEVNIKRYSGLFISYLQSIGKWNQDMATYSFGELSINAESNMVEDKQIIPYIYTAKDRPSFSILTKSGVLWDTNREEALYRGNLIHQILSCVHTQKDIDKTLEVFVSNGDITEKDIQTIKKKLESIVNHKDLIPYYKEGIIVRNESDIITAEGVILRPDRVVIIKNEAVVIDYKTGSKNISYHNQVNEYANAMQAMGYNVKKKIIIYINETITTEFIP